MSLVKRLWLAVLAIIVLSLATSIAVHTYTARHYLERQLQLKNIDNAQTLALALSQLDKDPVTIELLVAAQFDTGHYAWIRLNDPAGTTLAERRHDGEPRAQAPGWFVTLVPLRVAPGVAQVQDGWQPYGTLSLASHLGYAHDTLWQGMRQLLWWFALAALVLGLLGTWALRRLTRPLLDMVAQAEAIGERRFTDMPEPRTPELRSVVQAMNRLSQRVRQMLDAEAQRLETLRAQLQQDPVTAVANRDHLLASFDTLRQDAAHPDHGAVLLVHVPDLAGLNLSRGHQGTDHCLHGLAQALVQWCAADPQALVGRLNGSDFCVVLPGTDDSQGLSQRWAQMVATLPPESQLPGLAACACHYDPALTTGALLSRLDAGLVEAGHAAAEDAAAPLHWVGPTPQAPALTGRDEWGLAIREALEGGELTLAAYPVLRPDGALLHEEMVARLALPHGMVAAGSFLPWAERLGLAPRIDLAVCVLALQGLRESTAEQSINLSSQSLCDPAFRRDLQALLRAMPKQAARLWLELPEHAAIAHGADLHALVDMVRPLGCRVGLEHVGRQATRLSELAPLGLAFVKIHGAVVRAALTDEAGRVLLQDLCGLAHAMDMLAIAEGVTHAQEMAMLAALGVDAVTGPGILPSQK